MQKYTFDTVIDRRKSGSIKWNLFGDEVLPLWVADMDFPILDDISEALRARINHPFYGYQKPDPEIYEQICEWNFRRHHWRIEPDQIMLIPGVVSGFNWAASALVGAEGALAFQTPVYFPFYGVAKNQHIRQVEIPLFHTSKGYRIDFDLFEEKIKENVNLFLLCNPHNPVGRVFMREELERIGEICQRHGALICSDEIHCDLVFDENRHIPIATISEDLAQRTITLMAPSKTFNIPGLHFSYAICQNQKMKKRLEQARRGLLEHPNVLGKVASIAAYKSGEQWLKDLLVYLQGNRDYLFSFLSENMPEIRFDIPEGTYLAWLDCSKLNLHPSPHKFFLEEAKVAMNDGKMFADAYAQFVRLNFACPRSVLESALGKMSQAISQIGSNNG